MELVEENDGDGCDSDWATVLVWTIWEESTWARTICGCQSVVNLLYINGME